MDNHEIEARRSEIHAKMRGLVKELSEGKISTEQFNILYERYQNQLEVLSINETLAETNDMNTIAIRKATTGMALGMGIYHHRSGTMIETLGNFDVPPTTISTTLNEFSDKLERREYIAPKIQKGASGIYIVFMAKQYTTVIMVFRNEPSQSQIREVERLLHDFEEANRRLLDAVAVDGTKLAKPFLGFVRKKLGS